MLKLMKKRMLTCIHVHAFPFSAFIADCNKVVT